MVIIVLLVSAVCFHNNESELQTRLHCQAICSHSSKVTVSLTLPLIRFHLEKYVQLGAPIYKRHRHGRASPEDGHQNDKGDRAHEVYGKADNSKGGARLL